ncbi:hypothetical protein BDF20DRAFT_807786, partial [Mycotypha africana]|uniref:uncharacterized protein n=1 Tax=Mycotypha africana TaxID=64632 RepID=UPI0023003695
PALLDMMLEKQHIMEFNKAAQLSVEHTPFIQCRKRKIDDADHIISAYQAYIEDEIITLNKATQDPNPDTPSTFQSNNMFNSNSQALTIHQKPVVDICLESPPFRNPEDLMAMPAIQALHVVRLQLKLSSILGGITPVFLLPTALQRVIPHDIRIDYVPAGSVRDRLILFQDYYDMDECFQYLTQTIVFTGGDVRNPKNWTLDPSFNVKFWFLSHQMYD